MVGHVNVDFETSPRLTEVQIHQLFAEMGDEPFHRLVESAVCGGGVGAGCPAHIGLSLEDPVTGDRVTGMEVEAEVFVRRALAERGIEVNRLTTSVRA